MRPFILIIENNIIDRELALDLFEKREFDIRFASDVKSALIMLLKIRPALILTSLVLPKIDGYTLAQILKNDVETSSITMVAFTDFRQNDDHEKIIRSGFDGYISLPLETRMFSNQIKFFLNRSYK